MRKTYKVRIEMAWTGPAYLVVASSFDEAASKALARDRESYIKDSNDENYRGRVAAVEIYGEDSLLIV